MYPLNNFLKVTARMRPFYLGAPFSIQSRHACMLLGSSKFRFYLRKTTNKWRLIHQMCVSVSLSIYLMFPSMRKDILLQLSKNKCDLQGIFIIFILALRYVDRLHIMCFVRTLFQFILLTLVSIVFLMRLAALINF